MEEIIKVKHAVFRAEQPQEESSAEAISTTLLL